MVEYKIIIYLRKKTIGGFMKIKNSLCGGCVSKRFSPSTKLFFNVHKGSHFRRDSTVSLRLCVAHVQQSIWNI